MEPRFATDKTKFASCSWDGSVVLVGRDRQVDRMLIADRLFRPVGHFLTSTAPYTPAIGRHPIRMRLYLSLFAPSASHHRINHIDRSIRLVRPPRTDPLRSRC